MVLRALRRTTVLSTLGSTSLLLAACGGTPPPAQGPTTIPAPASSALGATVPAAPKTADVAKDEASGPSLTQLLNVHRATAPRALRDGDVVFLSDAPGTAQIFRKVGTADPVQLTDFPDRVAGLRLSPDAKAVVFLKDTGGDENDQIFRLDLTAGAKALAFTARPKVKHTLPVWDDGSKRIAFTSNARNGKDMDLYVVDATKPIPETLKPFVELSGSFHAVDFRGGAVLLAEERSSFDEDLHLVDVTRHTKTLLTKHTGDERYEAPRFSADGRFVYTLTDAGREFMALVALPVSGGKRKVILETDHDLGSLSVQRPPAKATGETLVVTQNVDGVEEILVLALDATRKVVRRTVSGLRGVFGSVDVSADGKVAYVAYENPRLPTEVFRVDVATGEAQRVTKSDHAGIDEQALVAEELVTLKSFDGRVVSTFWYAPKAPPSANAGAPVPRPVVITVHGGPEGQAQPTFSPVTQYLVAHGYAVAAPNVRGSVGYGKSFAHLDDKELREDSVKDLSEIGKFLAARPDVDPKRIALYGGSYGGYMVLAGLTLYPDQWAAGVDVVGIANFRTFLEQTAPYRRALREAEYGSLASDGPFLDRVSPIHKVEKVQAPLFVIHGTRDPRVPVGEAKQIVEALQARKLPVELLTFEDEGHGLAKRKNRLEAYPKMVEFLDRYVKAKR